MAAGHDQYRHLSDLELLNVAEPKAATGDCAVLRSLYFRLQKALGIKPDNGPTGVPKTVFKKERKFGDHNG